MKAILEFDLTDFDQAQEHYRCIRATDMAIILFELSSTKKKFYRVIESAQEEDKNINAYDGVDMVLEKLHELLEEHGVSLDKLIT
jgi:molecular chaperone GrpE (heat shock protein)